MKFKINHYSFPLVNHFKLFANLLSHGQQIKEIDDKQTNKKGGGEHHNLVFIKLLIFRRIIAFS